ncbi:lipopolysaccharide biosynthesis protein [Streptomyces sp. NPDC048441]|uniref:lipopolysaccharide biosynthesis protein n=1 Tax=Streptomyces sp. NPDC048441 TaxID=3365552 RepID=UPI00371FC3CD
MAGDQDGSGAVMPSVRHRGSPAGLVSGVSYSAIAQAAPLLANFALTPFLVHHLGLERFGVWSLLLIFLATLTVLDGGVGASLARFHAVYGARGDSDGAGRLVVGSLAVFVGLGTVVTGVCFAAAPHLVTLLNIPPRLQSEAQGLLLWLGPLLTLALASNSATALLQANAQFRRLAAATVGSCLVYAVAVVLVVGQGRSLPALAAVAAGRYALLLTAGLCLGARHLSVRRPLLPGKSVRREFGGYAFRMQLSGFTVFLNGEIDAFVIAAMLPVRYVGIYAAGYQVASALRSLPLYAFPPLLTRMTGVFAERGLAGATREFHALQRNWLPVTLAYGAVTLTAVWFAVRTWLGEGLALSGVVAAVLLVGYIVQVALTGIRTCFVRAIGRPGLETRYSWCSTLVNLALTVPLALLFGVTGVVLATTIGLLAGSLYFVVLCRRVSDLHEQRLPGHWAAATGAGVVVTAVGELLVTRLGWHGVLPTLLAGVPVLAGLATAAALGVRAPPPPVPTAIADEVLEEGGERR